VGKGLERRRGWEGNKKESKMNRKKDRSFRRKHEEAQRAEEGEDERGLRKRRGPRNLMPK